MTKLHIIQGLHEIALNALTRIQQIWDSPISLLKEKSVKLNQIDIARLRADLQVMYTQMQNLSVTMYSELDNSDVENIQASVYDLQNKLGDWVTKFYEMYINEVEKNV